MLPSNIPDPGLVLLFVAGAGAFAGVAGGGLEEVQVPRLLRSTVQNARSWLVPMYVYNYVMCILCTSKVTFDQRTFEFKRSQCSL